MKIEAMTSLDVCGRLNKACKAAGGQGAWAERHGLTGAYVSSVLRAKQEPGPAILEALGLRKIVRYVEKKV